MNLDGYIHKHLIKTDEWYKSIEPETQAEFLQQYKKNCIWIENFYRVFN